MDSPPHIHSPGQQPMSFTQASPVARLEGSSIEIAAFGRKWRLCRNASLEELWEAMGEADFEDERIPYWTELWPASLGLAQWLYANQSRIRARHCLDLGCGLGFTALVGAWLGADVLGCDYEMAALRNCAASASLNCQPSPAWICMDWRRPAVAWQKLDFIWGADIIYERRSMEPVLDFLDVCLAPTGVAWLAEPGRGVFRAFPEAAKNRGFHLREVARLRTAALREGTPKSDIAIWEAERK